MIDVVPDTTQATVIGFYEDGERWHPVIAWAIDVDEGDARGTTARPVILGALPNLYCVHDRTLVYWFPEGPRTFGTLDEAVQYGRGLLAR